MNSFRDDEVVQVQGRSFPVVGGRLRLAHDGNQRISVKTELVKFEIGEFAIVRAVVVTEKGEFTATGVATVARDLRLQDSLLELAETRSLARALRFAGYGVETCGIEEIGDVLVTVEQTPKMASTALRVVGGTSASESGEATKPVTPRPHGATATSAQQKAIYAISKKLGSSVEQVVSQAYPGLAASELSVVQASSLIDQLKTRADGTGTSH